MEVINFTFLVFLIDGKHGLGKVEVTLHILVLHLDICWIKLVVELDQLLEVEDGFLGLSLVVAAHGLLHL